MRLVTIAIFIFFFNYSSYAFISDSKLIECNSVTHANRYVFKYKKKLLSKPTLTVREKGLWKPYCSQGKLVFNEDSIMCKSKMYNSIIDLITSQYSYDMKLKPIGKIERRYAERFVCLIDGK